MELTKDEIIILEKLVDVEHDIAYKERWNSLHTENTGKVAQERLDEIETLLDKLGNWEISQ